MPIVGAALLAGLRGKDHARLAVLVLPLAWFVGGVLGGLPGAPAFVAPLWLPFLAVGGLVAADLKLPVGATAALIAALGLILGYPNGLAMAETGQGLRGGRRFDRGRFRSRHARRRAGGGNDDRMGANRMARARQLDCGKRPPAARVGAEGAVACGPVIQP